MKISPFFLIFSLLFFSSVQILAQDSSCGSPLPGSNSIPFDTGSMRCANVWNAQSYTVRYVQAGPTTWSFVLAAPNTNVYVGMGFSPSGNMIGSTALVGWIGSGGTGNIRKYLLQGQTPQEVTTEPSDQGTIQVANTSILLQNNVIYMAFQLLNTQVPNTRLIFSLGPQGFIPSNTDRLVQHQDMTRSNINYATGTQSTIRGRPQASLRRTHGLLNMLGWAIFIPIGAMVARYMRRYDPVWFYAHTSIQTFGFLLGVSGVICGLVLEQRTSASVGRHKGIGIFILTLGCLQVIAFLARPDKASKVRKFWNWYHFGVGRLLIFLAAVNVYYGIHVGRAGAAWNAGFSVVLGIFVVITVVMELRMWFKKT